MTRPAFRHLIDNGIKDLPVEALAEVADFVEFVRRRTGKPPRAAGNPGKGSTRRALKALSDAAEKHLEDEFKGYDEKYPRD